MKVNLLCQDVINYKIIKCTCLINLVILYWQIFFTILPLPFAIAWWKDVIYNSIHFAIQYGSSWTDTGNEMKWTVIIPRTGRHFQDRIEYDNFLTHVLNIHKRVMSFLIFIVNEPAKWLYNCWLLTLVIVECDNDRHLFR